VFVGWFFGGGGGGCEVVDLAVVTKKCGGNLVKIKVLGGMHVRGGGSSGGSVEKSDWGKRLGTLKKKKKKNLHWVRA